MPSKEASRKSSATHTSRVEGGTYTDSEPDSTSDDGTIINNNFGVSFKKEVTLTDLPKHIIGRILRGLSFDERVRCERVNRRVKSLVLELGWTETSIINSQTFSQTQGERDRSINEDDNKLYTIQKLEAVLQRAGQFVRKMDFIGILWHVEADSHTLCRLLAYCPNLTSLGLGHVFVEQRTLVFIANNFPLLRKLYMFDSLEDWDVKQWMEIYGRKYKCYVDKQLVDVFKCHNRLTHLDLAYNDNVTSFPFKWIPSTLRFLDISELEKLNDRVVWSIIKNCLSLETLRIGGFKKIHCSTWHELFVFLSKSLRVLELSSDIVCPDGVFPFESIGFLRKLKTLTIPSDSLFKKAAFKAIINGCRYLKKLSIGSCPSFSNNMVRRLGDFPMLQKLEFHELDQLTDQSLTTVARRCPYIQSLCLISCKNITDDSYIAFITHCKCEFSEVTIWELNQELKRRHGRTFPTNEDKKAGRCFNLFASFLYIGKSLSASDFDLHPWIDKDGPIECIGR